MGLESLINCFHSSGKNEIFRDNTQACFDLKENDLSIYFSKEATTGKIIFKKQ